MSQSSVILGLQCKFLSAKGIQGGEKYLSSNSHQIAVIPFGEPKELRVTQVPGLRRAEVHMKGMISVNSDSCIFPYIEKH